MRLFQEMLPSILLALALSENALAQDRLPPSRVRRTLHKRDPVPSAYPGPGTAYPHEWQYINFDMNKNEDKKNVEIIHKAFDGMRRLALAGLSASIGTPAGTVYKRWFLEDDEDDDENDKDDIVVPIFRLIIPEQNADGTPNWDALVGATVSQTVVIDNNAFPIEGASCDGSTFAYTDAEHGVTHFCQLGLDLPDAGGLSCESDLGTRVSSRMDNTGRLALHEVLHSRRLTSRVMPDAIVDVKSKDKELAYGPERAHALVEENPGLCTVNADNYAWLACNAFLAQKHCSQGDFEDPAGY